MIVVTLSTIPTRFDQLGPFFAGLAAQSLRPDRVIVYVPRQYRRWPDYDGPMPTLPEGVELRVVDEDMGPATKILPAVRDFAGQEAELLFCDDDIRYPPGWIRRFAAARRRRPDAAIAAAGKEVTELLDATMVRELQPRPIRLWRKTDLVYQLRFFNHHVRTRYLGQALPTPRRQTFGRSGYIDILEGYGGVLVRPDFFDETAFDIPERIRPVDDIWLSGMLARRGIPIWLDALHPPVYLSTTDLQDPLHGAVIGGDDRDASNRHAAEYLRATYGIWP